MKETPLVSIIIPTYNRAYLIGETLDSVLAQTYTNWECIVVDDGSTDDTAVLLTAYCDKDTRFQYHHRPKGRPKGANACRNYGFELSKGKWIQLLDSDDVLGNCCLGDRVKLVSTNESVNLLVRDTSVMINNIKQRHTINKDPDFRTNEMYLRMFLRYEIPWQTMGAFYSRTIFTKCKFDETLGRFQDVSFNIKVLSQFKDLKLLRDFKIDSYYRTDDTKILKPNFIANVLKAQIEFFSIHSSLITNKKYKLDLRKLSSEIVLSFLVPYFLKNKESSNNFLEWTLNSKIFNLHQKINFILLMFLLNTNIYSKKGIGMNKFRNYFKKVLNN